MLISFIFSYSEKFFVVFNSSFYFVLGQGPSARDKRQCGTRAHKAKLYKIEDKVVKLNQAIHDVLRGLYFTFCLGSRLNSP